MLENGPVLPRRVMGMAAADRSVQACFECDEHGTAPAFDHSHSEKTWLGFRRSASDFATMKVSDQGSTNSQRFEDLFEPDRNARSHISRNLR